MRKIDIVHNIANKTGISKVDSMIIAEALFREIRESLKKGNNVYIRGFGSFIIKKRKQKIGRIVKKNIAIVIPEHYIPAFKPAKSFVNIVKKSKAKETNSL